MNLLIRWFINALAIVITAYLLQGVHMAGLTTALIVALVLGIINLTIKPLLFLLTLPITILTLGLFYLVINALLILLTSALVPGFRVDGFGWALLFSIILTVVNSILHKLIKEE
jgi:putative membrane protein